MAHLSCAGQMGKTELPQRLIGEDGDRVGQIQAPGVGPHGDAEATVPPALAQVQRQAGRLLAEHEPAALLKLCLGVVLRGLSGG